MHNSGILEKQYWANQKKAGIARTWKKKINKEAGQNNETQLTTPELNVA